MAPNPVAPPDPYLDTPFTSTTLLTLRTSKMKTMRNLSIMTGIYKQPRDTPVFCSFTGLESDEHDLTFHGGFDKAVHQYFPGHYPVWAAEYPESKGGFEIGAFGENLVSLCMNERNVCIGDVISIGGEKGALLQVSLPRQPCFKLNHRFNIKNFAPQTWKKSRTGWYYRVLREGYISAGDEILLVERKHPQWTIERVQEYLHRDKGDLPMLVELSQIEEFGAECKKAFQRLIVAAKEEEKKKEPEIWTDFVLQEKTRQTPRITSFVFQAAGKDGEGEELDPGCFVRLKLPNGLIRAYSVVSGGSHRFQLGIAHEELSRGGSRYIHEVLNVGDTLQVGKITEGVPIKGQASNHIFIAAGIGLTAFLGHFNVYDQINFNYTLHYAVRSADETPFMARLEEMGSKAVVYDKTKGDRLDVATILRDRVWNSFVYVCGPQRLIDDVVRTAQELGIGADEIHYEAFQPDTGGDPFSVEVKMPVGKGKKGRLEVGEEETLMGVLRREGWDVDSSCETGNCGTCQVKVCEGKVEHRGSALSEEDKEGGAMLSCVSRGLGHLVVEW
ncbi:Carnitine monooxygenase reductase subunit [Lachnellula occidentalis]|uniref:Carnitine monooxygenase reductase subunit n=1 Tax=Lachnellula occidentalis TaxID=215460 RepID=A0A8H8S3X0_9HELO|nr:Carnitine monooxygenase reductase subunit [Lachnellula occidentalis]